MGVKVCTSASIVLPASAAGRGIIVTTTSGFSVFLFPLLTGAMDDECQNHDHYVMRLVQQYHDAFGAFASIGETIKKQYLYL